MILSTPSKNLSHGITQILTLRTRSLHTCLMPSWTGTQPSIHKPQALPLRSSSGWLWGFTSVNARDWTEQICGMSPHKPEPFQELPLVALWQRTLRTQYCLQQLLKELAGEVERQKRDNMDLDMGINRSCWRFVYWTHPHAHNFQADSRKLITSITFFQSSQEETDALANSALQRNICFKIMCMEEGKGKWLLWQRCEESLPCWGLVRLSMSHWKEKENVLTGPVHTKLSNNLEHGKGEHRAACSCPSRPVLNTWWLPLVLGLR